MNKILLLSICPLSPNSSGSITDGPWQLHSKVNDAVMYLNDAWSLVSCFLVNMKERMSHTPSVSQPLSLITQYS